MKALFAYPNAPVSIGSCIRSAVEKLNASGDWDITTWEQVPNWGRPLVEPILTGILEKDCLVADITRLNFNVTFEMGYAIGARRRLLPVINRGLENDTKRFQSIGIYDSLGYKMYENSDELAQLLTRETSAEPISITSFRDTTAPLFLLETPVRSDDLGRIILRCGAPFASFSRHPGSRANTTIGFRTMLPSATVASR
jgi:hypothetical protein